MMRREPDDRNEAEVPARKRGAGKGLLIAIACAVVLSPVLTWTVSEFVLIPRMREAVSASPLPASATTAQRAGEGKATAGALAQAREAADSFRFENLVVNLAGTMGTRYLKTSFIVEGDGAGALRARFESTEVPLRDAALSVLASLTLADLEEVGARNFIRERLVRAFNQTLGEPVAEQIYFIDFVVQ